MRYKIFFAAVIFTLWISSCERYLLAPDPANTPIENFEYLWDAVDRKYSYFDYKEIDWRNIYETYRPRITNEMTDKELFDVLAAMLGELRDGHVNLTSPFDRSRNWQWYLSYPPNFNENIVYRNYLGENYRITGPLHNQIIDSVLYIYYGSFMQTITQEHINLVMARAEGLKGVIIDIRNNGGGAQSNAELLTSAFIEERLHYGFTRIKDGPAREDFSPWRSLDVAPRQGNKFLGRVAVLCNRRSFSSSSFFALMMKTRPNTFLVGDHTGGGGGTPAYGELPNGWLFRFSSTQTVDTAKQHIESGVLVDIKVDLAPEDEVAGVDTIIEEALKLFHR